MKEIVIAPEAASVIAGMSLDLTALGIYSDGSTSDVTVEAEWSSDNEEIVSVNKGRITGLKPGSAVVSAAVGKNFIGSADITVLEAVPDQYVIVGSSGVITDKVTIIEGLNEQVRALAVLNDGTAQDVTESVKWTSSKSGVASVDKGLVSAKKAGKSNISVSLADNEKIGEFAAEVVKDNVASVTLNKTQLSMAAGYSDTLSATASFASGKSANINTSASWKSSNGKIASVEVVDPDVKVSGLTAGNADITVSFGGKSAVCKVTVTEAELVSMAFEKNALTIVKGLSEDLSVFGGFSDGTSADITKDVKFTSDNTNVAVIESAGQKTVAGRVHGRNVGEAAVTASAENGLSAEASVKVADAEVTALTVSGKDSVIPG
ncbi:Ig-like domain-containing protein [bacterium]|nr:Ig-like domain-containing protein [bacterium]